MTIINDFPMKQSFPATLASLALLLPISFPSAAQTASQSTEETTGCTYSPTKENLASREAFREDRFGIFIHWGIYSMLATGEWTMTNKDLNYKEYAKLAGGFYPASFDAKEWVSDIKEAGARYICFTTRHHDGFSMFDSKATDYDIMDASPFHRDIVKEIAEECHRQGIAVHFYYSLIDWTREDAPRGRTGLGTGRPEGAVDQDSYYRFMKAQLTELLTQYGPVRAIWFDGHWDQDQNPDFDWRYDELYSLIHSIQPGCLVGNNHHLVPFTGEDIQIFERDLPGENTAGLSGQDVSEALPLETCQTMNGMWGYKIEDRNYKSAETLIQYLAGAAGRDANLLLNVGPQPDGNLPSVAIERMKEMGKWLKMFGHTVYGTRGGEMQPHEWGVMTSKGNLRYVHIMDLQDNSLFVPFKAGKVRKAVCLNDGKKISFSQDADGVLLKLGRVPDETDCIIELELR